MSKSVSIVGDSSDHGGTLTNSNTDGSFIIESKEVCAEGCSHSCPIPGHGITSVTAITTKSYINGKLIITNGATAGCGAVISSSRDIIIEG